MTRVVGFVVVVVLWAAVIGGLVLRNAQVRGLWDTYRAAALPVRVTFGVILLPWVTGVAIWFTRWPQWLRVMLVAGLAWATVVMFSPWQTG